MSHTAAFGATARNAPCPCGSGRKYKLCCVLKDGQQREKSAALRQTLETALAMQLHGESERAAILYREVLEREPNNTDALHLLGVAMEQAGRHDRAAYYIGRAVALNGMVPEYHRNLGIALHGMGNLPAAIACFRQALQLRGDDALVHQLLGDAQRQHGDLSGAAASYRAALTHSPGVVAVLRALGAVLRAQGDLPGAEAIYRELVPHSPADAFSLRELGDVLGARRNYDGALALYRAALSLAPRDPDLYNNLGLVLGVLDRHEEARSAFKQALSVKPDAAVVHMNLVGALQHLCAWSSLEEYWQAVRRTVVVRPTVLIGPFLFLTIPSTGQEQLACARNWAVNNFETLGAARFAVDASSIHGGAGRLHIGYLSADYRAHPVAALMVELLERHERQRVEVSAYSIGPDDGSAMRGRVVRAVDHFVDLSGLSHAGAAARIRADGVEVLVDLNGYTALSRPQILALRAAPVQVNYLGYPGTMGAPFMDYIIADRFIIPEEHLEDYSERVAYLPECYQPNDRQRVLAAGVPSRAACGLPEEGVVYCCFNQSYKIQPAVFAVWMRVLGAVPGSVLWLLGTNEEAVANLKREAGAAGIAPERLVFAPRLGPAEHLARHRVADLFLDTVPVNAHTTCSDALWAGLPVLTCVGETFVSRVAGSLLRAVGLPELVTESLEEYEGLAVGLGRDPARLGELRARLWVQRETAVLFDSGRTARGLEGLYERMWAEYCRTGLGDGGSRTPLWV